MTDKIPSLESLSESLSARMEWVAPQVQEFDLLAETQFGAGFGGDFTDQHS